MLLCQKGIDAVANEKDKHNQHSEQGEEHSDGYHGGIFHSGIEFLHVAACPSHASLPYFLKVIVGVSAYPDGENERDGSNRSDQNI